jgi:hypothetical protein
MTLDITSALGFIVRQTRGALDDVASTIEEREILLPVDKFLKETRSPYTRREEKEAFVKALYQFFGEKPFLPVLVRGLKAIIVERSRKDSGPYIAYSDLMLLAGIDPEHADPAGPSLDERIVALIQENYPQKDQEGVGFAGFLDDLQSGAFVGKAKDGTIKLCPHASKEELQWREIINKPWKNLTIPENISPSDPLLFPGVHCALARVLSALIEEKYGETSDPYARFALDFRNKGVIDVLPNLAETSDERRKQKQETSGPIQTAHQIAAYCLAAINQSSVQVAVFLARQTWEKLS